MIVLLLGINARYTHTNLALRYIRESMEGFGHDLVLKEFAYTQPQIEILEGINEVCPQILLLSAYIWNSRLLQDLIPDIRDLHPQVKIILGGPEAAYQAEHWFEVCPQIDLIITGPGETALKELAQNNFILPREKTLFRPGPSMADLPFPYREEEKQELMGRYLYYESSRGCPFSCAYCLSGRKDHSLEFKPVTQTLVELSRLCAWAPDWPNSLLVKFVDRTFNAHKARAREIWAALARWDPPARFHFEVHPALLEAEDLQVLSQIPPGRFQFEIGVQSTTPKTLETVGRATDWPSMKPRIRELIALGNIPIHLDLIAGLPGEGPAEVAAALDELYDLSPGHIQLGFLKNLPGSPLHDQNHGFICQHQAPYQVLETPWMSRGNFEELRRWEELVEGIYNNPKTPGLMAQVVEQYGGFSQALAALSEKARKEKFDLRTRNPEKLKEFAGRAPEAEAPGSR